MQGNAADIDSARALEATRFDFEGVVATVSVLIDPSSMRKTEERGLNRLWPLPPISEDAPDMDVNVIGNNVGDIRHDHDFHGLKNDHHSWHAVPPTGCSGPVIARPARRLVSKISLIDRLILVCQRSLLTMALRLARIPGRTVDERASCRPEPLPLQIGVLTQVDHFGSSGQREQSCGQGDGCNNSSVKHSTRHEFLLMIHFS